MRRVWLFLFLLTTVACNPVMKYSFCPLIDPQCEPTKFASNSTLEFGNVTSGVYSYKRGEERPLSVSCTFHEPLHWILTAQPSVRVNSISSNFTTNGSHLLFYYHIHFNGSSVGLIRCESYNNSNLAAEIYIAQTGGRDYEFSHFENKIIKYLLSSSPKRDGDLIVPCTMYNFDANLDPSNIRLKKLRQSDMIMTKVTPECFNCFPQDERNEANCGTSCPYNISERLWNDAERRLGVNKSANQWQDCIRDYKCAFETVRKIAEFKNKDCNGDVETTCSDYISAISSYPERCVEGETSSANFIDIEACIVKDLAESLESTEADYDPRFGFRLKTEKDKDAVYVCSSNASAVYMATYEHTTKKIKAQLTATDKNSNGPLKGLYCTVPEKSMENVAMELVPCSTLFECELQLTTIEDQTFFRKSNTIVLGENISLRYPLAYAYGKVIQNPPSSGAVFCIRQYNFQHGYIYDLQYFFTGLDFKLHFSNSAPTDAVISLKEIQTDLTTSAGTHIELECTVANFIVFPSLLFVEHYSNGTWKTERMLGLQQKNKATRSAVYRMEKPAFSDEVAHIWIRCRAVFRNSREEAEASMIILPAEPDQKTIESTEKAKASTTIDPDQQKETIESTEKTKASATMDPFETTPPPESSTILAVVLIVTSGIILLGSVACAIYGIMKYKKSAELRQLTLDEINEFLNGNAALAPGSSMEVNVESIGFPECLQIAAVDLKMNTHEVLGEGEFGRCVSGHYHDQKVAVKTTKASMDVEAFKQFLREVKIMAYLGKHDNVIEFLGAVVDQLKDRKCMAVVELSPYGDLLRYLRQNEKENLSNVNLYANLPHGEPLESSQSTKLGSYHLSYFCEQIASGMEFVVEKGVIHGDLAARNVLVFPDYVVKITDFGLSRKLYTASNYKKKTNTPLPWRSMAIESLKYMEFSPMTDMWAYGVTAWEIFALGEVPYAGLVYSREFINEVEQGRRLQRPKNATEEIYQFMKLTWDRIPSARPSFQDAKSFFRRLTQDASSGGICTGGQHIKAFMPNTMDAPEVPYN